MPDFEPLSPVDVEAKLRSLVSEMTAAQTALRDRRDAETQAEIAHRRAWVVATHDDKCPKPARGSVTVDERKAWLEEQTLNEWSDYRTATTAREIAQDRLRVVLAIAETVRSLGASVRTAYSLAGSS